MVDIPGMVQGMKRDGIGWLASIPDNPGKDHQAAGNSERSYLLVSVPVKSAILRNGFQVGFRGSTLQSGI